MIGVGFAGLGIGKKPAEGLRTGVPTGRPHVASERQSYSSEHVVTTREQNLPSMPTTFFTSLGYIGKCIADNKFRIHEDVEESRVGSTAHHSQNLSSRSPSPKHPPRPLHQEVWDQSAVLRLGMPVQMPSSPRKPISQTNNDNIVALHDNSSDSDTQEDSSSDIPMASREEEIDWLKAVNADLKSESKYYRLMAEITMKTAALHRGCETTFEPSKCNNTC